MYAKSARSNAITFSQLSSILEKHQSAVDEKLEVLSQLISILANTVNNLRPPVISPPNESVHVPVITSENSLPVSEAQVVHYSEETSWSGV